MTDRPTGKSKMRPGGIYTVGEFAGRARDRLDLERGASVTVDRDEVPEPLCPLIPYAERWAIPGSGPQMVFIERERDAAPERVDAFVEGVAPLADQIRAFIRASLETGGARDAPAAVSHFSCMISAYELARPVDPDRIVRNRERQSERRARRAFEQALRDSSDAMRERRFEDALALLEPYEAWLEGADRKRLEFARRLARG